MSAAGENRWRRQGQGNRQNQDRSSSSNTPVKDAGRQPLVSGSSGNAWGAKGKVASSTPAASSQSQAEHHTPVRDFNANEVRDFLKKKYLESVADQPSVYHKVQGDSVAKRSSGAWGVKGNMSHLMPSGQDFFTQLKKQLSTIEPSKSVS